MYNNIHDPQSGISVPVCSFHGRFLLKQYLNTFLKSAQVGGDNQIAKKKMKVAALSDSVVHCAVKGEKGGLFSILKADFAWMLRHRSKLACPDPKSGTPVFRSCDLKGALDHCNIICISSKCSYTKPLGLKEKDKEARVATWGGFMLGRRFPNHEQQFAWFDHTYPWKYTSHLGNFVFIDYICKYNLGPANVRTMINTLQKHVKEKGPCPVVIQPEKSLYRGRLKKKQPLVEYYKRLGFSFLPQHGENFYMVRTLTPDKS